MTTWDGTLAPRARVRGRRGRDWRTAKRAQLHVWRHQIVSAGWVASGLVVLLAGSYIVGRWCFGVTLMAAGGGAVYAGLARDDGTVLPRRGERTVKEILRDEQVRSP